MMNAIKEIEELDAKAGDDWSPFQELERATQMSSGFIDLMLRSAFIDRTESWGRDEEADGGIHLLADVVVERQANALERVRLALGGPKETLVGGAR